MSSTHDSNQSLPGKPGANDDDSAQGVGAGGGQDEMPIVGLGGSAGSLAALQAFLAAQSPETGMAFIVVVHLSPNHHSIMAEILQRSTRMPVMQVVEKTKVCPNHVYVIPPGRQLAMTDGHLMLLAPERERGRHVAIDLFFRTLAETHGSSTTAVVLSGNDSDGALGIKRIKEVGGLTIAQDPQEAEVNEMPRAAIRTEMVDWILPVADMPARLESFWQMRGRLVLPEQEAAPEPDQQTSDEETALKEILACVKSRTARDFSDYKRATVLRRLARRMRVNNVTTLRAYYTVLGIIPGECGALVQDLLVSVTNFFRDREVFSVLEQQLPALFEGKTASDTIRGWIPGCATGEEAYSIAILLNEEAAKRTSRPRIQLFATDLDETAIASARMGRFPLSISADVSPERLQLFFHKEETGYRISETVRDQILFVAHDMLREAPFSRLDLISCRNLLIYLNRQSQSRVFDTFYFALRDKGLLLLGASENAEDSSELFEPIDKKARLFRRRGGGASGRTLPALLPTFVAPSPGKFLWPRTAAFTQPEATIQADPLEITAAELHSRLIEALAPPSLVVNRDHHIVHLSAKAGQFLQWRGGEATSDILRLVPVEARSELRAALLQAVQAGAPVEIKNLVLANGPVCLRIQPVEQISTDYLLVLFIEEKAGAVPRDLRQPAVQPESLIKTLEQELTLTKQQLRGVLEQHGLVMEEMKAANEELQAMNEELRSATEELETGREELQSINEELQTVNLELKAKIDEVARANNDLQTLMASTAIPTVFLDRELRIKRFTPAAVEVFNLIPTDVGRPFSDLRHALEYPEMFADAENVIRGSTPSEREVRGPLERCYITRITTYRAVNDVIEGVVLTLVDITQRMRAEAELHAAKAALSERASDLEKTVALRTAHLQEAVSELEHFSYALTHDMRAPLRAMRGFAELVEDPSLDDGTRQEYTQRIKIAAERLDQLIADSLHFSRIPRARLPLEPVPLEPLLRDLIETYPNFHKNAADIVVEPLPVVMGNRAALTQCFANLMGNAVKFAKVGSRAQVRISADRAAEPNADDYVRIWVRDQGVGIPAQALTRIFGLFQRATQKYEGTGLGLAIVRKVVEQIEGRVGVESQEGVGTEFWVEFRRVNT